MMRFSITSPALGKRQCRMLNAPARRPVETQKIISKQPARVWQWSLSKQVVATVCLFTLTPILSNLIVINPVLGKKKLERLHLTR